MRNRANLTIMFFRNLVYIFLAVNIVALGVALLLKAGFGTDPLTVLQDGLHVSLHITVGQAAFLYNSVILLLAFLFARRKLGMGSIIFSLTIGPFIDLYISIVAFIVMSKTVCFVLGLPIMCLGSALLIDLNLGQNGLDCLLLTLHDKKGVRYALSRSISDTLYTVCGWMLGGKVGAGTVIAILFSGLIIDYLSNLSPLKNLTVN